MAVSSRLRQYFGNLSSMADRNSLPRSVADFLTSLYGELPPLRMDSPLSVLNFRPSDAMVIAHWASKSGIQPITDAHFSEIHTISDLVDAMGNLSDETGSS